MHAEALAAQIESQIARYETTEIPEATVCGLSDSYGAFQVAYRRHVRTYVRACALVLR